MVHHEYPVYKLILYWLVHITWGIITFIAGSAVALVMLISGHKPRRFGYSVCFITKWMSACGFSIGPFFFIAQDCEQSHQMYEHEHGHGLQTLWWGPLMIFVISLPSAIRFSYREKARKRMCKKLLENKITPEEYNTWLRERPGYDDIWFEAQATKLGKKYFQFYAV